MIIAQFFNLHVHLNDLLLRMRYFDPASKIMVLIIQYLIE